MATRDMPRKKTKGLLETTLQIAGGAAFAWWLYSRFFIDHEMILPPALNAEREEFSGRRSCFLSYYADTRASGRPLLLIHSINAAASSNEMRPIFEHYRGKRPVYALDLPGFGFSERSKREYSVELYVGAILDMLERIHEPVDVIALSLGAEFVAQAALHAPEQVNSLTLISPTGLASMQERGFTQRAEERGFSTKLEQWLNNPAYSQALYDLLATRASLRFFLSQSFEGPADENLLDYDYLTTHQPGARYAPLAFISGKLFTPGIAEQMYQKIETPVLVLYDRDNFTSFDGLAPLLERRSNWRARRILHTKGLPHFERMDKVVEALESFWGALT